MLPSTEQLTLVGHLKQLGAGDARAQRAAPAAAAGAPEAEPAAEVEAEVTEESFAPRLRRFVEGESSGKDTLRKNDGSGWHGLFPNTKQVVFHFHDFFRNVVHLHLLPLPSQRKPK